MYVNVARQNGDPHSLLQFIRRLVQLRKRHPKLHMTIGRLPETGTTADGTNAQNSLTVKTASDKGYSSVRLWKSLHN